MRAVIQRVKQAHVEVEGRIVGRIGPGLLVLLGVGHDDAEAQAQALADKIAKLRIFEDEKGLFNLDLHQARGQVLVVSQFTLLADTTKGRRPSFTRAASPSKAEPLYEFFRERLAAKGFKVEAGRFGARMQVHLVNDGPVTLILDAKA